MDTGAYMQNQMDDQIEASKYYHEEFCNNLESNISNFIKENNYTWTVDEIIKEYTEKYTKGFYVSFTCKKIIEKFKDDLKKSTGI
jgi:hypothetical protein